MGIKLHEIQMAGNTMAFVPSIAKKGVGVKISVAGK